MYEILSQINKANDIKNVNPEDLRKLAKEIRAFLINNVSKTGGHLASNLGVVELTMALHLILDFPEDKLVWDVGHQSYVHKILTGRREQFDTLRTFGGLSGFPRVYESECDAFDVGHASTSVSAALGFAHSRNMQGKNNKVFAVIGDGSMTGGLFYEALNNAVSLKSNIVIVLNDNNMSISRNVGGMSSYLTKLRTGDKYRKMKESAKVALKNIPSIGDTVYDRVHRSKSSLKQLLIPGMMFEDMGLTYIGPVDGHNLVDLVTTFNDALKLNEPVVVHVKTKKGKGYIHAEQNPSRFHGIDPFDVKTGEPVKEKIPGVRSYTEIFGETMCELAADNDRLCAVCAAMPIGTGLSSFADKYPKRFFDVGIAEEHAVTFAGALACDNMVPVVAIYSTFLQRAYDQIIHDVCLSGHHVVFAIDRGGIVGNDGDTHQGTFDISYLTSIPNLTVMAPKNGPELKQMLKYAVEECTGPVAIRYPRGNEYNGLKEFDSPIVNGEAEVIKEGNDVCLLALGTMVGVAKDVCNKLENEGYSPTLVNMRFAKPLDYSVIDRAAKSHKYIITLEDNVINGGISEHIASYLMWQGDLSCKVVPCSLPDSFIEHGTQDILYKKYSMDVDSITEKIRGLLNEGKA